MKARVPKTWERLSQAERKAINDYALNQLRAQEEKDIRIILDLYMKMVCMTLHDTFGFGETRLNYFLGQHYMLFHRQRDMVSANTQLEYLDERMRGIFRKGGFPQQFIDGMLGEVEKQSEEENKELL